MVEHSNPQHNTRLVAQHFDVVQARWEQALAHNRFDAAIVAAGSSPTYLFDDQTPTFRANPHLAQWLTTDACEGSLLLVAPGKRAQLLFLQPKDYWHQPPQPPRWLDAHIDITVFDNPDDLGEELQYRLQSCGHVAYVGTPTLAEAAHGDVNPPGLISQLHYFRAYKTKFEAQCMRLATGKAVQGHIAAANAFAEGASEFEIQLAYLRASQQTEADLPYPNIVALNEHAGILHYQHYERLAPSERHSFLIDAGARFGNYAADVTRTYAAPGKAASGKAASGEDAAQQTFAELVSELDAHQRALIDDIRVGQSYLNLHEQMHQRLGAVLRSAELISCSAEAAFDAGITRAFLPHGLGHLLGLQTHDVGGHQVDADGTTQEPPDTYQALRLTREIEADQAFTIEPGIYFIPQLLDELRAGPAAAQVRWRTVDALLPFGGIRIEDNVLIGDAGVENFTRDAFTAAINSA